MAWSVPCPDCRTQNEPDGSGAVLCSSCGRFYRAPLPGGVAHDAMAEIEAQLAGLGIAFQRVSETSIQVVRPLGPQTVHVTIDSARTIRIVSASGVADLTVADSAGTRLQFDPAWKERYDFDLALEDKTFALLNALEAGSPDLAAELPAPPPAAKLPAPAPPPAAVPAPPPAAKSPPGAPATLPWEDQPIRGDEITQPRARFSQEPAPAPPARLERTPSSPRLASMVESQRSAPDTDPSTPFPIPAVILPSTPDGRPPVLLPSTDPVPARTTPSPQPLGVEPARPSGRVHIGSGNARDVIDRPISAQVEMEPQPEPPGERVPLRVPTSPGLSARSGERRGFSTGGHIPEPGSSAPPVLPPTSKPPVPDDEVRPPVAPDGPGAVLRGRRGGTAGAALLGLAIGAAIAMQVAVPAPFVKLFPPTAASEVRAGAQAARSGDVDGALAHFRRASELDPRFAPAWRNMGVVYALRGNQVESEVAYRKYLELEPDGEQARVVRGLLGGQ